MFAGRLVGAPASVLRLLARCVLPCTAEWWPGSTGQGTAQTMRWFPVGTLTQLFCSSADFYGVLKSLVLYKCLGFFAKLDFSKEVKDYLEEGREEETSQWTDDTGTGNVLWSRKRGSVKTVSFLITAWSGIY